MPAAKPLFGAFLIFWHARLPGSCADGRFQVTRGCVYRHDPNHRPSACAHKNRVIHKAASANLELALL